MTLNDTGSWCIGSWPGWWTALTCLRSLYHLQVSLSGPWGAQEPHNPTQHSAWSGTKPLTVLVSCTHRPYLLCNFPICYCDLLAITMQWSQSWSSGAHWSALLQASWAPQCLDHAKICFSHPSWVSMKCEWEARFLIYYPGSICSALFSLYCSGQLGWWVFLRSMWPGD